jgi:hypothetical protein
MKAAATLAEARGQTVLAGYMMAAFCLGCYDLRWWLSAL